ncbi:MAG: hypothetical protein AAF639_22130 [Chloroflexota bacterium]
MILLNGVYEDGMIKLAEIPQFLYKTPVILAFLEPSDIYIDDSVLANSVIPLGTQTPEKESTATKPRKNLRDYMGAGTGSFESPAAVDAFLRKERDAWER